MKSLISNDYSYRKTITPQVSSFNLTKAGQSPVTRFLNQNTPAGSSLKFAQAVNKAEENFKTPISILYSETNMD